MWQMGSTPLAPVRSRRADELASLTFRTCVAVIGVCFVAAAPIDYWLSRVCISDCITDPTGDTVAPIVLAAIGALLLWPLVAALLRRRDRKRGWRAPAISAALSAYGFAIGRVAFAFGQSRTIFGDTAWIEFWLATMASWFALALVFVRVVPWRRVDRDE